MSFLLSLLRSIEVNKTFIGLLDMLPEKVAPYKANMDRSRALTEMKFMQTEEGSGAS